MRAFALLLALLLPLAGCLGSAPVPGDEVTPSGAPGLLVEPAPPTAVAANPFRDREADATINPLDPRHMAVLYMERPSDYLTGAVLTDPILPGTLQQGLAVTRDGGETWTRAIVPRAGAAPPPPSKWNLFCAMGDPNVFFDRDGLLHVVTLFMSCGAPGLTTVNGIAHATTSDDGATWSEPDIAWMAAGGVGGVFNDREWTAYDPVTGRIGIAWTAFYAGLNRAALTVIFSEDGGRTWTLPEEVEVLAPTTEVVNYLLHTAWGGDGRFHITGSACPRPAPAVDGVGAITVGGGHECLLHFSGNPGGPWDRVELPIADCPGLDDGAQFGYASSAAVRNASTLYAVGEVLDQDGFPLAACVFASRDNGATWNASALVGTRAAHPWVALAPGDVPVVAYLELAGDLAVPTLAALDPVAIATLSTTPLGPAFDVDTDDDGLPEVGDYDVLAASGGAFLWALTHPNEDGRKAAEGWNDLDVRGYRGTFRAAS